MQCVTYRVPAVVPPSFLLRVQTLHLLLRQAHLAFSTILLILRRLERRRIQDAVVDSAGDAILPVHVELHVAGLLVATAVGGHARALALRAHGGGLSALPIAGAREGGGGLLGGTAVVGAVALLAAALVVALALPVGVYGVGVGDNLEVRAGDVDCAVVVGEVCFRVRTPGDFVFSLLAGHSG